MSAPKPAQKAAAKAPAKAADKKGSKFASIKSALFSAAKKATAPAKGAAPAPAKTGKAPAMKHEPKKTAAPAKGKAAAAAPAAKAAAPAAKGKAAAPAPAAAAAGKKAAAPGPALTKPAKGKKGKQPVVPQERMAGPSIRTTYDANGDAVCREVACEGLSTSAGYCRMHYIKNWKKIKRKEGILKEGKLNNYIEELVAKYPDKYIEAIRQDLANDKDFAKVIYDLDLDESVDDFEGEGESLDGIVDVKRDFDDEGDTGF